MGSMAVLSSQAFSNIFIRSKTMHSVYTTLRLPSTSLHKFRRRRMSKSFHARAMVDSVQTGLEDGLTDFMFGKRKATDVVHMVWQHVVRGGDFVIDATCGNGHDTMALAKMVCEGSRKGLVYGMDLQQSALQSTYSLLDCTLTPMEREQVKLFSLCHSRMEELVPEGVSVRLVAFNLGYLPGGNKEIITRSETTLLALDAATKVLGFGGLISIMSYVGHPGGWEEYEAVRSFAVKLPATTWVSTEHEILNRPAGPVLIFLFKREFILGKYGGENRVS